MAYTLKIRGYFKKKYKKIAKNNLTKKRVRKALENLEQDPFYPSLNSHKVKTKKFGEVWSSWVTGDLRIIWNFDDEEVDVLDVFDLGGHDGANAVYN